jgi:hypothetical protein
MLTPAEYNVIELDLVFFVDSLEKSLRAVWFLHAFQTVVIHRPSLQVLDHLLSGLIRRLYAYITCSGGAIVGLRQSGGSTIGGAGRWL